MNPKKTKVIASWIVSKDKTKVRRFLRLGGYYRRLVNFFSKLLLL